MINTPSNPSGIKRTRSQHFIDAQQQHRRGTHRGSASLHDMASTAPSPPPARRTRNATECSCMPRRPILMRITRHVPWSITPKEAVKQRIANKANAARAHAVAASHSPTTPTSRKASLVDLPAIPHCQLLLAHSKHTIDSPSLSLLQAHPYSLKQQQLPFFPPLPLPLPLPPPLPPPLPHLRLHAHRRDL